MNERDWGPGNPVWEDIEQERRLGLEKEAKVRHTVLDDYLSGEGIDEQTDRRCD